MHHRQYIHNLQIYENVQRPHNFLLSSITFQNASKFVLSIAFMKVGRTTIVSCESVSSSPWRTMSVPTKSPQRRTGDPSFNVFPWTQTLSSNRLVSTHITVPWLFVSVLLEAWLSVNKATWGPTSNCFELWYSCHRFCEFQQSNTYTKLIDCNLRCNCANFLSQ